MEILTIKVKRINAANPDVEKRGNRWRLEIWVFKKNKREKSTFFEKFDGELGREFSFIGGAGG
ncbi:MAG: hypothetical protein AB1656_02430 [Candidatus Omnitrophota bacterium]